MGTLSAYEERAWVEIHATLSAPPSPLARWLDRKLAFVDPLLARASRTPVGVALNEAVHAAMCALSDAAVATVAKEEVCAALGSRGAGPCDFPEVAKLPLEVIDAATATLPRKYVAAAAAEGAATGMLGAAGLVADVPLLALLALRGVSETALYHGIEAASPGERAFMLQVLLAAAPTEPRAGGDVSWLALSLGKRDVARRVARAAASGAVERLAQAIGLRLARVKLVQLVPVVSAVWAGGLNAWYVRRVLRLARALCRRRLLAGRLTASGESLLTTHDRQGGVAGDELRKSGG